MDTATVTSLAEKYWSPVYDSWRKTLTQHWPAWEREFHQAPASGEYDNAFRRWSEAGHKEPPAWNDARKMIFGARGRAARERDMGGRACEQCQAGLLSILLTPHGRGTRALRPDHPEPIAGRDVLVGIVPCSCAAGNAHNNGWGQGLEELAKGVRKPKYTGATLAKLAKLRIADPAKIMAYRDRCEALYREAHGLEPEAQRKATHDPAFDAAVARIVEAARSQPVDDSTADEVLREF